MAVFSESKKEKLNEFSNGHKKLLGFSLEAVLVICLSVTTVLRDDKVGVFALTSG